MMIRKKHFIYIYIYIYNQYKHMKWLGFLQIQNFFQQGCQGSKPFFVTRLKRAPVPIIWIPSEVADLSPLLPLRVDLIVNNGPATWHPDSWVRGENRALGQKTRITSGRIFLSVQRSPRSCKKAVSSGLFCGQWPWHLWGEQAVISAVGAA